PFEFPFLRASASPFEASSYVARHKRAYVEMRPVTSRPADTRITTREGAWSRFNAAPASYLYGKCVVHPLRPTFLDILAGLHQGYLAKLAAMKVAEQPPS